MQNQVISGKEHFECCFAKKLFTCHRIFLVKILKRKYEKDLKIVLAKVRYYLQKEIFEVFKQFYPKDRSFTCFEDGCPQLTLRTDVQNTAVLKCCRPRTSDTAVCAFRNVS